MRRRWRWVVVVVAAAEDEAWAAVLVVAAGERVEHQQPAQLAQLLTLLLLLMCSCMRFLLLPVAAAFRLATSFDLCGTKTVFFPSLFGRGRGRGGGGGDGGGGRVVQGASEKSSNTPSLSTMSFQGRSYMVKQLLPQAYKREKKHINF